MHLNQVFWCLPARNRYEHFNATVKSKTRSLGFGQWLYHGKTYTSFKQKYVGINPARVLLFALPISSIAYSQSGPLRTYQTVGSLENGCLAAQLGVKQAE